MQSQFGRAATAHPPIQGDVVDLDARLGEKLFEIPVGQPVAEDLSEKGQEVRPGVP